MGILWILPDSFMHVGLSCLVSPAGGYLHIHSSYSGSVSRAQLRVGSGGRRVRVSSASRALLLQWDSQKQEWENTTKQKNRIYRTISRFVLGPRDPLSQAYSRVTSNTLAILTP